MHVIGAPSLVAGMHACPPGRVSGLPRGRNSGYISVLPTGGTIPRHAEMPGLRLIIAVDGTTNTAGGSFNALAGTSCPWGGGCRR